VNGIFFEVEGKRYVYGVVMVFRDVTEQYEKEKQLHERVKELTCLYEVSEIVAQPSIPVGLMLQKIAEILPASWLHPEKAGCRITIHENEYRSPDFKEGEYRLAREVWAGGRQVGIVEMHYPPEALASAHHAAANPSLDEERRLLSTVAKQLGRTIERKRSEAAFSRELQHRVKNTMNTMTSLLTLGADRMSDNPGAAQALSEASGRFRSMELLYDQLYRVTDRTTTSVEEYIKPLVQELVSLFPCGDAVRLSFDLQDFEMDGKRLSSLGLIVNELVTNAVKHAFRELAEGLDGTFRIERGSGTRAVVEFSS